MKNSRTTLLHPVESHPLHHLLLVTTRAPGASDSRFLVAGVNGVNQKELGKLNLYEIMLPSRITITVLLMRNHPTTHARNQQEFASISQLLYTKTTKNNISLPVRTLIPQTHRSAPVPIDPVRAMR